MRAEKQRGSASSQKSLPIFSGSITNSISLSSNDTYSLERSFPILIFNKIKAKREEAMGPRPLDKDNLATRTF